MRLLPDRAPSEAKEPPSTDDDPDLCCPIRSAGSEGCDVKRPDP
jgi:hypothetical protein